MLIKTTHELRIRPDGVIELPLPAGGGWAGQWAKAVVAADWPSGADEADGGARSGELPVVSVTITLPPFMTQEEYRALLARTGGSMPDFPYKEEFEPRYVVLDPPN